MKKADRVLRDKTLVVKARAVNLAIAAAEQLEKVDGDSKDGLKLAVALRMAATNDRPQAEVELAVSALRTHLEAHQLLPSVEATLDHGPADYELMQQVVPRVWIGSWHPLKAPGAALEANGITHVVTVVRQAGLFKLPPHVLRLMVRVDDTPKASLEPHFDRVVEFVSTALRAGGSVFVHCGAGVSRSASCVIAYLMAAQGLTLEQATQMTRAARPCIRPNEGFLKQLRSYAATLAARTGASIAVPEIGMEPMGDGSG